MAFPDAFKNAKKKGGKKIPPKAVAEKGGDKAEVEAEGKDGKGFAAAFANAKKKKKKKEKKKGGK